MANPFTVRPWQTDLRGLQGLGTAIGENRQQAAAQQRMIQGREAVKAAMQSGDPNQISQVMVDYPELSEAMDKGMKFANQATKTNALTGLREILSNPERTPEVLRDRIEFVASQGGDPTDTAMELTKYHEDPEGYVANLRMQYGGLAPKQEFEAYQAGTLPDYKGRELNIKEQTLDLRKLENQSRLLEQRLKRETNDLKREELRLKIEDKRNKIDSNKEAIKKKATQEVTQIDSLKTRINDFIGNDDYVGAMTGWRGRSPAVTDTGLEAEAFFDAIKNNLTLENLDKMSGVLSETDIKILSSAASALRAGMGRPAMMGELDKILDVLAGKEAAVQERILGGQTGQGQSDEELINKYMDK